MLLWYIMCFRNTWRPTTAPLFPRSTRVSVNRTWLITTWPCSRSEARHGVRRRNYLDISDDRQPLLCRWRGPHLPGLGSLPAQRGSGPHWQQATQTVRQFSVSCPKPQSLLCQVHLSWVCRGHGDGGRLHERPLVDRRVHRLPRAELLCGPQWPSLHPNGERFHWFPTSPHNSQVQMHFPPMHAMAMAQFFFPQDICNIYFPACGGTKPPM